jgi:SAM-dependent methyltransferase
LTKAEFDVVAARHPYYRSRGRYMSVAAAQAGELITAHGLQSALELGPNLRPVVVGADVMDIRAQPELDLPPPARFLLHDATRAPWPIADKQYDLFVALQVFEHLRDDQNAAFMEVCRVARHAVISVPIDWEMDDPRNCHHRISQGQALSWFRPFSPTRVAVGNPGPRKRLIYVFENLESVPTGHNADAQRETAIA